VLKAEKSRILPKTLEQGLKLLEQDSGPASRDGNTRRQWCSLYDTYGAFPMDLTADIAVSAT